MSQPWTEAPGRALIAALALAMPLPIAAAAAAEDGKPSVRFTNVAREAGLLLANVSGELDKRFINETVGNGVCLGDIDNDGWLDIFLPNGSRTGASVKSTETRSALYRNRGDGRFEEITEAAGVGTPGFWAQGCVFADYDADGRIDLLVTGFGRYYLFRNTASGRFADVTRAAGLAGSGWSTGAAFGDYDGDGRIDLFISHYLDFDGSSPPLPPPGSATNCFYRGMPMICGPRGLKASIDRLFRNTGGGRFTDVTKRAGLRMDPTGYALGAVWSDLDNDGDLDLYVANDSTPNYLYRNEGNGRFAEVGTIAGVAYNEDGRTQSGMGVDAGDFDNDGQFDLLVTNFSHDYSTLYRNEGGLLFIDLTLGAGLGEPTLRTLGWGTGFFDYDNDGLLDIFIANGHVFTGIDDADLGTTWKQINQLFRNLGNGKFQETTGDAGPAFREKHSARGTAFGDLDNDGDIDMVVNNMDEPPSLLRNDGGNSRSWIGFRLVGRPPNVGAIGARVAVTSGSSSQIGEVRAGGSHISSNDPRLHFGLGDARAADRVTIRWPDGTSQTLSTLEAGRYHTVQQPEKPRVEAGP
ncbi:MAG: CRTAC1 family protein [Acidobacteria bacterium]|nr:CRTAC1 family protein [Acidobacteriota bacterium]